MRLSRRTARRVGAIRHSKRLACERDRARVCGDERCAREHLTAQLPCLLIVVRRGDLGRSVALLERLRLVPDGGVRLRNRTQSLEASELAFEYDGGSEAVVHFVCFRRLAAVVWLSLSLRSNTAASALDHARRRRPRTATSCSHFVCQKLPLQCPGSSLMTRFARTWAC